MSLPLLTLGAAKSELAKHLIVGEEAAQLNLVAERLLALGKFKWMIQRLNLRAYDGLVTLPGDYETMIGATVRGAPAYIRDPWFEVVPGGYGSPGGNYPVPIDRGDGFVCFREPAGCIVAVVVEVDADEGIAIAVAGCLDDGTSWGESAATGTVETASTPVSFEPEFQTLTKFAKPQTDGAVKLINAETSEVLAIAQPWETEVCLRRYEVPTSNNEEDFAAVVGLCKRRFVRAIDDSDTLQVSSIYSLRMGLEAVSFEDEGDDSKAAKYWNLAVKALDDALSEHRGSGMRTLPVYCRASAGSKLRSFR